MNQGFRSLTGPAMRGLAGLLFLGFGAAASAESSVLQSIDYVTPSQQESQLQLTFSGPAPDSTAFTTSDPARLAIDFVDTTVGEVQKAQQFTKGLARNLRLVQAGNRTRVVVGLDEVVPYEITRNGNVAYVVLRQGQAPAATQSTAAAATARAIAGPMSRTEISNVDFRRAENGAGRFIVTLSNPSVVVDLQTRGDKLVAEFAQTHLAPELERRLDVTDFATPIRTIDSLNVDDMVRVIIAPEGQYEYLAYQVGNVYTIDVKPPVKIQSDRLSKESVYTGEKLSLNFQNIDVRAVLQLIGDFTGLNMVASDTVTGNITLRLKNVPWDQALEIILKAKGLGMRKNGNVVLVAPSEEIAAREKLELEAGQQIQELAPLHTEFFQVNYAKAKEIAALVKAEGNSLLSKRGNITIDERTNTLMILDTADKLDEVRRVIGRLDIPIRQVLIESRIVIASDQFSKNLGARFGVTRIAKNGSSGLFTTSGSVAGTDQTITGAFQNSVKNGGIWNGPTYYPSLANRLNVDLGLTGAAGRVGMAILGNDYLVDLELSAMQSEGKGEVISSPRVVTANQKEAKIEQGVEIPYLQATSSGATSVAFKKAVLSLGVTPQITPDDRVVMDLKVNKDNVGEVFNGVPSINTRNVDTQVLVNNGSTVVLGGIFEQTRTDEVDKVPLLGDLPVLGALFRQTRKVDDKAELLVFVTPKILKDTGAASLQ